MSKTVHSVVVKASVSAVSLDVFESTHCIVYFYCFLSCFLLLTVLAHQARTRFLQLTRCVKLLTYLSSC